MKSNQQKHKLVNPLTRYEHLTLELPPNTYLSYVASGRLEGRHAFVTGGDSKIGRAVVIAIAREGAKVAVNYLPEEEPDAQALADFLDKDPCVEHELIRIPGDLTSSKFRHQLVQVAHKKLGALDLIVSNAGTIGPFSPVAEMSPEVWDQIMKANLYANFHIIQAASPLPPPGSSIVVADSVSGLVSLAGGVAYAASKAALRSLINGVAPGYTYTPILVYGDQTLEGINAQLPAVEPVGRLQQPAELAPVYVTLADDQLSHGTGSIYGSHGGFLDGY